MAAAGGLILAAGAGTRFGDRPKLLALLHGRPVLEHAVGAMCAVSELERVVVVLGARADEVAGAVDFGRAEVVRCADWPAGQSESLRCGVDALAGFERVLVTLGDAPTVTSAVIGRMLGAVDGARAVYGGRPGHPVVLGSAQLARLSEARGDVGARDLLAGGPTIECGDLSSGRDIDTTLDLEEMRHAARAIV